jgi:CubicO group peptidase (beta-lactamase class C family)
LCGNAYANINSFNKWLYDNGHFELLKKVEKEICKTLDKSDPKYNTNLCHLDFYKNNLDIKIYTERKSEIPYQKNPNRDTLLFYVYYYLEDIKGFGRYLIEPSKEPLKFNSNLREDKLVKKQLQKKAILSYLYFEDDQIIVDEITPDDRFGLVFKNDTKWNSMSMGKSLVSYVTGHAICEGYIDGVNSRLNDWPLIENTLYHDQKLIDLLNMAAGDQKVIDDNVGLIKTKRWYNSHPISSFVSNELKDTKKIKSTRYHYNGLVTNIIMNYVIHKSNGNFQELLNKIFQEKAKIKNSVFFLKQKGIEDKYGPGRYSLRASRYDYLRIAKAIMDDYQNQTCVGKYLKEIHEKRIKKNIKKGDEPDFNFSYSYGGQFHFDYPGLKNKIIFGLGGYAGQAILIDMENSRIVVLNSAHYNNSKYKYNVKKLLINPIKKGIN